MRYASQKGTGDILPADIYKWQKTEKMFADVCHSFGYEEIRIPTFEQTDLMQAGAGRMRPDKQAVAWRGRVSWCQGGHGVGGITPGVSQGSWGLDTS